MRKLFAIIILITSLITIFSCNDEVEYKLSEDACLVFDQNLGQGLENTSLLLPNIITSNGDGKNDYYYIYNIDSFPNNSMTIYDRNNNQIAYYAPYTNNWNGQIGGNTYGNGLYYFKLTIDSISSVGSFLSLGDDDDYYDISLSDCNCTGDAAPMDSGDVMLAK